MNQSPRPDEPTLDLEATSAQELERVLTIPETQQQEDEFTQPPPKRRCDSSHREILRQPFLLDR